MNDITKKEIVALICIAAVVLIEGSLRLPSDTPSNNVIRATVSDDKNVAQISLKGM